VADAMSQKGNIASSLDGVPTIENRAENAAKEPKIRLNRS
jgi:hypothetical protein